jgi:hypothetical protein
MILSQRKRTVSSSGQCADCCHFRNDARFIEAAFGGLTSLGSAYGSVRADDGICLRHNRYLGARSSCGDFSPQSTDTVPTGRQAVWM